MKTIILRALLAACCASGALNLSVSSPAGTHQALERPTELQYWNPARADNGYNFFGVSGTTYLLDMEGKVVHTWPIGNNPHLLSNGNVLDTATNDPSGFSGFREVNWNGSAVWSYVESRSTHHPHHDFTRIYNAKLGAYTTLYIANKDLTYAQLVAAGANPSTTASSGAQMDAIVEVDSTGTIVWEWCFFDHVVQDYDPSKPNYVGAGKTIADYPHRLNINLTGHPLKADWLHCNSLDFNQSLDQIVINSVQGEFYVIDHGNTFRAGNPSSSIALAATSAGDFLYRFGDPARYNQGNKPAVLEDWTLSTTGNKQLGGAHDIQWIAEGLSGAGHFLVFNNAQYLSEHTAQSYIMEINPYLDASGKDTGHYVNPPDAGYYTVTSPAVTDKTPKLISKQVVWNYASLSNVTLFSTIGSSAQRLPNGNTLICADTFGYIMEVTPEGDTVWDYIVPITASGILQVIGDRLPMVNSIFRAYRYEASHPAFAGRALTPGKTIAGRTTVANPYAGTANYRALQRQTETLYWDSTNAYHGYTLFAAQGIAYLIDMQGRAVHTWATGTDPRLLDNGNVLDWVTNSSGNIVGLKELDWNGNTVWQYYETRTAYHPHGDFIRIYDPKLGAKATLYLANKDVTAAQCLAAGCDPADAPYDGAQIDSIVEVDMSGNVIWEWSFWDHAVQNIDATKPNYVGSGKTIADYAGRINLNLPGRPLRSNWLDCNSLDYNQSLDQILVNSRQGELYVIDHGRTFLAGNPSGSITLAATTAGDFLYRFGDPARYNQGNPPSVATNWENATSGNKQIGGSSNAQWIGTGLPGAGHLLVFNNNQYLYQRTPQSYVIEINPYLNSGGTDTGAYVNPPAAGYVTWTFDKDTMKANQLLSRQVVWKYGSVSDLTLFSHFGSSAQRLPNGNTLICATTEGYMVEVDATGNVVWEYINPVTSNGTVQAIGDRLPMTNAVPRAIRYAAGFSGFVGRDLTPGSVITETSVAKVAAAFTLAPVLPIAGQSLQLTDTSTGRPTAWSWTFGDGGTSSLQNPIHVYAVAGTFTITLKASNAAGSGSTSQSVIVSAAGAAHSIDLAVSAGGAATAKTLGSTGPLQTGYAVVNSSSGNPPNGTAVFSLIQNGVVVSECGVPSSPPTTRARLFVDYGTGVILPPAQTAVDVFTGIAIVNRGTLTAKITYTLRDKQGLVLALGRGTLAAGAHRARYVSQLAELAPDFSMPADFPSATRFGTLDVSSDQQLSILALRLTDNQRGETIMTSVPAADLTAASTTSPLYFPQIADGGGFGTRLILLNTTEQWQSGYVRFFDDYGAPLAVKPTGEAMNTGFQYLMAPGGLHVLQTDGSPLTGTVGWAKVVPDLGSTTPVGAAIFRFTSGGYLVTESGVPSAAATTRALVYVDMSNKHDSGIAIAAIGGIPLRLQIKARRSDGTELAGGGTLDLPGDGHKAAFAWQWVAGLDPGFRGVLEISGAGEFAAVTLRSLVNARGDYLLTTFPLADLTQPAQTTLVFPQVAAGGGFQSEIILLSSGAAAGATVSFFDDDGMQIAMASTTADFSSTSPMVVSLAGKRFSISESLLTYCTSCGLKNTRAADLLPAMSISSPRRLGHRGSFFVLPVK